MTGDAELRDAVFLEEVGAQYLHRIGEIAYRIADATADQQRFVDLGFILQGFEVVFEELFVRDRARREVGHRLHAFGKQALDRGECVGEIGAGQEGHEHGRAGTQQRTEIFDLLCAAGRDFNRRVLQEIQDVLGIVGHSKLPLIGPLSGLGVIDQDW
jgi:hypothetical protein